VLALVRVFGNDDMAGTLLRETDNNAHGLPVTGEGNHPGNFHRIAGFLPVLPTEILGEPKKGGLSLESDKSEFLGLWVDVLEGGGVDRDQPIERLGRKDRVDVTLLGREVVGVFPIGLGFIGDLSRLLFLIRRVCAGLVVLEIANEFGVDTDRAGNDTHDVLSEGPSLVGADDGSVGRGLIRAENADYPGGYMFCGEGEGEGYCKRESFRDSNDDQGDRDD